MATGNEAVQATQALERFKKKIEEDERELATKAADLKRKEDALAGQKRVVENLQKEVDRVTNEVKEIQARRDQHNGQLTQMRSDVQRLLGNK